MDASFLKLKQFDELVTHLACKFVFAVLSALSAYAKILNW